MFLRLFSLLLAIIISGPNCWCGKPNATSPVRETKHACCAQASKAQEPPSPSKGQDEPCSCNKCLVKRNLANDQIQPPSVTWASTAPVLTIWAPEAVEMPARRRPDFPLDTGPPQERQPIFMLHCALLL